MHRLASISDMSESDSTLTQIRVRVRLASASEAIAQEKQAIIQMASTAALKAELDELRKRQRQVDSRLEELDKLRGARRIQGQFAGYACHEVSSS